MTVTNIDHGLKTPAFNKSQNNETILKIEESVKHSFEYIKEALSLFFLDLYQSLFSLKIITKLPFFILSYGLWTSLGVVDAIYYVGLSILALKVSKDLVESLEKTKKYKSIKEHFPIKNLSKVLIYVTFGAEVAPLIFFTEIFTMEKATNLLKKFNFKVIDEAKLIHKTGFIGNFATFNGILIAPIVKEILFRGYIQSYFSEDNPKTKNIFKTALKTSLVFALFHFSPTSGLINIPILITYFSIGLILSLLKEKTDDHWAVSSAHIFYSFISTMYQRHLKLP